MFVKMKDNTLSFFFRIGSTLLSILYKGHLKFKEIAFFSALIDI